MKATRFRVQNFRNIEDSGWVTLDRLTAFVGRNESGKSSLLKALHKFNPATPEPYDAQREFPRDRYTRDYLPGGAQGGEWPVCSVEFEIPAEITQKIARLLDPAQNPPVSVIATRYFDGTLGLSYQPPIRVSALTPDLTIDALRTFASAVRLSDTVGGYRQPTPDLEPGAEDRAGNPVAWAMGWVEALADVNDLRCERGAGLLRRLCSEAIDRRRPETEAVTNELLSAVEPSLRAASKGSAVERIDRLIERNLPVLIYFENYGVLDSAISLPQFLEARKDDPFDSRVRTIDALFKHVALDPAEVADLGEERVAPISIKGATSLDRSSTDRSPTERAWRRKEERAIRLSAASLDISREFSAWWSQRRHRIRYHADGDYFRVWVADDHLTDVEIELEQRSKGFQWFFSFFLVFLVEAKVGHKRAILLLDEPGLHLHPTAQQELAAFLADLSQTNQLVYTTHSPFLIDGEHLSRVRPILEDDTGHSKVATETSPRDSETVFPVRLAAAFAAMKALFRDGRCVLVRDWSDFYYLHLLSRACAASDRMALQADIAVIPCGGQDGIQYLSSLCPTRAQEPLLLLDSDGTGQSEGDAPLRKQQFDTGRHILLDEAIGRPGSGVQFEDILGQALVLQGLNAVLDKPLSLPKIDHGGVGLTQRIEAEAKGQDVRLPAGWRTRVAQHLASSWSEQEPLFDEDTLNAAASLFYALTAAGESVDDHPGRIEEAAGEPADSDGEKTVPHHDAASASVGSDVASEDARGVDEAGQEVTEEDWNVIEMIARMNDDAEAVSGTDADEGSEEEEGVLERIAKRENEEEAETETGGILDRVADNEREEREADGLQAKG